MVGGMNHRFLSLPIRPALGGVAFASLSVQIIPTAAHKELCRQEIRDCDLFNLPEPEPAPRLHPVGGRRFPVERFFFWAGRASKGAWSGGNFRAANTDGFKSKPVAASGSAGSA